MTIGVSLPQQPVYPPQPNRDATIVPNATRMRDGLWDARRETFRARGAILDNCILGGFLADVQTTRIRFDPGVVQLMLPRAAWSATPANGQLYHGVPLTGSGKDGAYRAELSEYTYVQFSGLTNNTDSIIYLKYDYTNADRVVAGSVTMATAVAGSFDWTSAVPLLWVRMVSGVVTQYRDLRVFAPWLPRTVQARYEYIGSNGLPATTVNVSALGGSLLLPNTDIGSFWLTGGEAIVFYVGVQFGGEVRGGGAAGTAASARSVSQLWMTLSRGDPADNFAAPHLFHTTGTSIILPVWHACMPTIGQTFVGLYGLFRPQIHPTSTIPGVYHFNGIHVADVHLRGTNNEFGGTKPVAWAIMRAWPIQRGSRGGSDRAARASDVFDLSAPQIPAVLGN